jgi:hypothetical protein
MRNKLGVLRWGVVSPPPNPQFGGPPPVGCARLLIQYIRSYPPYLEAVSSIRNLRRGKLTRNLLDRSNSCRLCLSKTVVLMNGLATLSVCE